MPLIFFRLPDTIFYVKKINLQADKRKIFGRGIKKLRKQGILPANIFGKDIKSLALQLDEKSFLAVYKQAGETSIIDLNIDKKISYPILITTVQYHPVTDALLHVDFRKIDLKEKVQVAVPIEIVGSAPGVVKGGVLVKIMSNIQVEALPTELPEKISIDISKLEEIGQSIAVKDLKIDSTKVKLLVEDENQLVIKIEEPAKEEVEEKPAETVAAEGAETAPVEGETAKTPGGVKSETKPTTGGTKPVTPAKTGSPTKPEAKPNKK